MSAIQDCKIGGKRFSKEARGLKDPAQVEVLQDQAVYMLVQHCQASQANPIQRRHEIHDNVVARSIGGNAEMYPSGGITPLGAPPLGTLARKGPVRVEDARKQNGDWATLLGTKLLPTDRDSTVARTSSPCHPPKANGRVKTPSQTLLNLWNNAFSQALFNLSGERPKKVTEREIHQIIVHAVVVAQAISLGMNVRWLFCMVTDDASAALRCTCGKPVVRNGAADREAPGQAWDHSDYRQVARVPVPWQ
ncbi:hypothetical protein M514_07875 [Trichuris suis]|uniref:Uncharacterized protein n=1 Tax=Trichuris suis TaxID=68888 RepID=A0A085N341_9BILA|nr:hypothetical protein M513_07875 [Trichuris suis]KFD63887.1 hypothetical protein M514_07875 [Trichuris suis]